ncbi:hypothetical protein LOAG_16704 [Loa loa]|uniref:Uncharacterized protein n=1 Tax=Loa loa TaxID=7209 RepID=A0A1S0ULG0_LOALO|nr:hypothetical protein LOAG_16704 [Loa loa]EJD76311.1 hypothetical protein LOAG_16704 [Loa loa]
MTYDSRLEKQNDRTDDNSSVRLESLYPLTYGVPRISPIIVAEREKRTGRDGDRNESSYQIMYVMQELLSSTPFTGNLTLMPEMALEDRADVQNNHNNFFCELVSSHPMVKRIFSQRTRFAFFALSS